MEKRTGWRRRTFLVNRRLQLRFIGLLLLQMGIILTSLSILVYTHVSEMALIATRIPFEDHEARFALQTELMASVNSFYLRSLVLLAVTTVALVIFGLLASHKLAGPVVKLERHLSELATGGKPWRPIAFRKNDNLDAFAETLNRVCENVEIRRLSFQQQARALVEKSEELHNVSDVRPVLAELEQMLDRLKEAA